MTNPFSNRGVSDEDYARSIGTLVGEVYGGKKNPKGNVVDYEFIADIMANRVQSGKFGATLADVAMGKNPKGNREFSTWSPKQKDAYKQATAAYEAILNPEKYAALPANIRAKVDLAVQGFGNIQSGLKRGLTEGHLFYNNPKAGKQGFHRSEAKKHGEVTIGKHRAAGEGHIKGTKFGGYYGPEVPTLSTPREKLSQPFATEDYSQFGPLNTPREAIAPAAYSPASLDFGPDFASPPSQARGPVTDPYGFSNVNTAVEAAPGSFAGYGPNAFGALDQAPIDYGATYPELSAGLYSTDIAAPNVPAVPDIMGQFDVPARMTEQEAIERAGLAGQRPSENVETRFSPYGETVDEQANRNAAATEQNDYLAALYGNITGQPVNPASFTTNPYEVPTGLDPRGPTRPDAGRWGGTTPFNDKFADLATPTFQDYENRAPLAGLGIGGIASLGPVGMGTMAGVEVPRDYSAISSRMYPDAVADAVLNAPIAPMTIENFNAIFGDMPDDATGATGSSGSTRGSRASASFSPAVNAAQAGGPYSFSDLQSLAPVPDAATIAGDVTGYGAGGAFGSRAPSPGFDFNAIVNDSAWSGPYTGSADVPAAAAQPAATGPVETGMTFPEISESLYGGPAVTANTSPFSPSSLGPSAGFGNYGNYDAINNPVGYSDKGFSQAPNVPAPQQREIVGYETITREVPNPAWSDWSKEYGTKNAAQDAWLAADEDKFGLDPIRSSFVDRPIPEEPSKTVSRTAQGAPIYSSPAVSAASIPSINAQPAASVQPQVTSWTPGMTAQAQNFSSLLGSLGGYGLQGVGGTFDTGFNLAGMGGGWGSGSVGGWGGGYSDSGYGGYGGISPGDAGYGSDARSGSGNMGAGNLYQ